MTSYPMPVYAASYPRPTYTYSGPVQPSYQYVQPATPRYIAPPQPSTAWVVIHPATVHYSPPVTVMPSQGNFSGGNVWVVQTGLRRYGP